MFKCQPPNYFGTGLEPMCVHMTPENHIWSWNNEMWRWNNGMWRWNSEMWRWNSEMWRWNNEMWRWNNEMWRWNSEMWCWNNGFSICGCHPARWAGLLHFAPSALLDQSVTK